MPKGDNWLSLSANGACFRFYTSFRILVLCRYLALQAIYLAYNELDNRIYQPTQV